MIVAAHAPSAILAARGRHPVCAVGTGFTLPPHHTQTFPALRPDTVSFRPEFVALEAANAVLKKRGAPLLGRLPELLDVETRLVATVAALDPYAPVRREPYARLGSLPKPTPLPKRPGVFAFLDVKGKEALNAIDSLAAIAQRVPVEAYLRGSGAAPLRGFLNRCGVRTYERPAPITDIFTRSSVVLSQGGHGTSLAALAGARASVVLPAHFESMLNGLALEKRGVARVAWGGAREAIDDMLDWALGVDEISLYVAAAEAPEQALLDIDALLARLIANRAAA
jgi:UDP:flavonoid glycosyltransferase YjiC (YdhE family)